MEQNQNQNPPLEPPPSDSASSNGSSNSRFGLQLLRHASQNSLDESSQRRNQSNDAEEDMFPINKNSEIFEKAFGTLDSLRKANIMCDVTLVAGEETEIHCHRVVLAASSNYFYSMFTNSGFEETQKKRVHIHDIDSSALEMLVDYMYTSMLNITETTVMYLLPSANLLQLSDVKEHCCNFLKNQLHPSNCLGIKAFATTYDCFDLVKDAEQYTDFNFTDVIDGEEFLSLNYKDVANLISSDKITVPCEEKVFEAVLFWVNHDVEARKEHVAYLMDFVRFPLLNQDYLLNRVESEPLLRLTPKCKDLLIEALKFHLLKSDQKATFSSPRTKPRQPIGLPKVLIVIGGQAPKAIRCIEAYCFKSERWKLLVDLPSRRCRAGVAVCDGKIYLCGGFNGSLRVKNVDVYDPQIGKWSSSVPMNARRSTLGVIVLNNFIYAIGGFDGNSGLNSAERFDLAKNEWENISNMFSRRSSVGVGVLNGKIYAVGGYCGSSRSCLSTVECYDPETNTWSQVCEMSVKRSGASVGVLGGLIYAIGGHEGPIVRNSVEVYDPVTNKWEMINEMLISRRNAGIITYNNKLYIIAGDDGSAHLSSVEVYDPKTATWTILHGQMCVGRSYAGVAVVSKPMDFQ